MPGILNKIFTPGHLGKETKLPQKIRAILEKINGLLFFYFYQRSSRGQEARGQGQGHKKIRGQGQGQPFRGQTLSKPRTGKLEAKAKDQGHKRKCSLKKKVFTKFFQAISKKKVFTKIFQTISTKKRFPKNFSSAPQNFNNSKNTAVLEPRTGQFSRT